MDLEYIVSAYLDIVKNKKRLPSYVDFLPEITKYNIKYHCGNITALHEIFQEKYPDILQDFIVSEHTVFTPLKLKELKDDLKKYKRFVVSTVVSGKDIHKPFYESLKLYAEKNNAKLLFIGCKDVASRKHHHEFSFPVELRDESFIFEDTQLNDNLFISSIKLSAKHIKPITGLARIGQRNGSYIFASPKQFLEYVINTPEEDRLPHAIMTTGAITINDYNTDRYMSDRTSYIAANDHVYGAIIVEIESKKRFHFRQIQADNKGSFIDLGWRYNPDRTNEKVQVTAVLGDLHAGDHEESIFKVTKDMLTELEVEDAIVHDAFSGYSISHYDEKSPHKKSMKAIKRRNVFHEEIKVGADVFTEILGSISGNVIRVKGNHDEWFERYLERGGYIDDPINHYDALEYARYHLEGIDPLVKAYEKFIHPDLFSRIIFLKRDDPYKIGHIECGQHGDIGLNGSRGSLIGAEKAYGSCVIGHAHSAAIHRSVYRVGTMTKMRLGYNVGSSTWTHTHALVYDDGSCQLISILPNGTRKPTWKI